MSEGTYSTSGSWLVLHNAGYPDFAPAQNINCTFTSGTNGGVVLVLDFTESDGTQETGLCVTLDSNVVQGLSHWCAAVGQPITHGVFNATTNILTFKKTPTGKVPVRFLFLISCK